MKQIIWSQITEQHVYDKHGLVIAAIADAVRGDGLLDILETHRPTQYPGQRRYIVQMQGNVYVVSFRETETHIVLITAWADSGMRKRYLG